MKVVAILAAVLLVGGVATHSHFAGRSATVDEAVNAIPPVDIPASLGQSGEAGPEVKLALLALLPHGFESQEMYLDAGEYLFIIGNRTGLKEVNVRLDRQGKERLATATVGGRPRDWKQRLKLTPGNYLITADDNPAWTCRIVVRP